MSPTPMHAANHSPSSQPANQSWFHTAAQTVSEQVLDRYLQLNPGSTCCSTPERRAKSLRDVRYHLLNLGEAMATRRPALFVDYVGWVQTTLTAIGIDTQEITASMAVMRDVLVETLPEDEAAIARHTIDEALQSLAEPAKAQQPSSFLVADAPLAELANSYLQALLNGKRHEAMRLIQTEALTHKNVGDIYLYVLQPVQREIGRLWQTQQLSVAMEHFCSETTQLIMSQLYPYLFTRPAHGHLAVATCVSGEMHGIGVRMVSDFLEMAGWQSYYLGANTPTDSILQTIIERRADVLALSATLNYHIGLARDLIAAARHNAACAHVKILVGGHPFNLVPDLWRQVGADGYGRDAVEAVRVAERLVLH